VRERWKCFATCTYLP